MYTARKKYCVAAEKGGARNKGSCTSLFNFFNQKVEREYQGTSLILSILDFRSHDHGIDDSCSVD